MCWRLIGFLDISRGNGPYGDGLAARAAADAIPPNLGSDDGSKMHQDRFGEQVAQTVVFVSAFVLRLAPSEASLASSGANL